MLIKNKNFKNIMKCLNIFRLKGKKLKKNIIIFASTSIYKKKKTKF